VADLQVFFQPYEKLQEFLVEEREDVNARSIEQSRRNPKKGDKPKAKTPAVPAKASPATSSVAAAVNSPKPMPQKGHPKMQRASQRESLESRCRLRKRQRLRAYSIRCLMVVFMGINAGHVKPPPAKPKDSKADSKAKPKSAATKVTAAVAIVAALSSMVAPSHLEPLSGPLTPAQVDIWCRTKLCRNRDITVPSFPDLPMTLMKS